VVRGVVGVGEEGGGGGGGCGTEEGGEVEAGGEAEEGGRWHCFWRLVRDFLGSSWRGKKGLVWDRTGLDTLADNHVIELRARRIHLLLVQTYFWSNYKGASVPELYISVLRSLILGRS